MQLTIFNLIITVLNALATFKQDISGCIKYNKKLYVAQGFLYPLQENTLVRARKTRDTAQQYWGKWWIYS